MSRYADIQEIRRMANDRRAKYGDDDELAAILLRLAAKFEQHTSPQRPLIDDAWEE